jgi:hypothetical protein
MLHVIHLVEVRIYYFLIPLQGSLKFTMLSLILVQFHGYKNEHVFLECQ